MELAGHEIIDKQAGYSKLRRILMTFMVILWMIVIFWFSSRTADESQAQSHYIGYTIGRICVPGFEQLSSAEQEHFAESIDHGIRKTGHGTEYAILGILLIAAADWRRGKRRIQIECLGIASIYAASDEFHQLFVPGRAGMITDVMIDTCGALLGILLIGIMLGKHMDRESDRQRVC